MDDFKHFLPTDEDIKKIDQIQSSFYDKYSNRPDEYLEGYDINDLLECFKAAGDTDERNVILSDDEQSDEEEAIESDESEGIDQEEGAIGYSDLYKEDTKCNRHEENENSDGNKQLVAYKSTENKFEFLAKNYGKEFITKLKNAYLKRSGELENLNLKCWKRSKTYESFNESNLKTPNYHASSKSFVRATEQQNCTSTSMALSPTNVFKMPDPVNLFRNNITLNGFPAYQGSFNFGHGDSTLPLPLQELINQSQRRFNLKIREMHYDLSIDACDVTSFFQPNQSNAIANMSDIQAIENGLSTHNNTFTNQLKQIENIKSSNESESKSHNHEKNIVIQEQEPPKQLCEKPKKKHTKNTVRFEEDAIVSSSKTEKREKTVKPAKAKSERIKNSNDTKRDVRTEEKSEVQQIQIEKPKMSYSECVKLPPAPEKSDNKHREKSNRHRNRKRRNKSHKKYKEISFSDCSAEESILIACGKKEVNCQKGKKENKKEVTCQNDKKESKKEKEVSVESVKKSKDKIDENSTVNLKKIEKPEKPESSRTRKDISFSDSSADESILIACGKKEMNCQNDKKETKKEKEISVESCGKKEVNYQNDKKESKKEKEVSVESNKKSKDKIVENSTVNLKKSEKSKKQPPLKEKPESSRKDISFSDCSADESILIACGKKEMNCQNDKKETKKEKDISVESCGKKEVNYQNDKKESKKEKEVSVESNKKSKDKIVENSTANLKKSEKSKKQPPLKEKPESSRTRKEATNKSEKVKETKKNNEKPLKTEPVIDLDTSEDDDIDIIRALHAAQAAKKNVTSNQNTGPKIQILSEEEDSDDVIDDMEFFRNAFKKNSAK